MTATPTTISRAGVRILAAAMAVGLIAAACSDSGQSVAAGEGQAGEEVPQSRRTTEVLAGDPTTSAGATESTSNSTSTEEVASDPSPQSRRGGSVGECPAGGQPPSGPSQAMQIVDAGSATVELAVYPRPDYEGNPWTHWGQGIALDDGRFVSGIGDHLGLDGNSYVYVYDPSTSELTQVGDVATAVGQNVGEWGQGKIHAQMVQTTCDQVLMATYWGRRTEGGHTYEGGHILALDTADYGLSTLGVPVPGFGIPSLAAHEGLLYGEGVDPARPREDERSIFFVFDPVSGELVYSEENAAHDQYRSILVADDGSALIATGNEGLLEYSPGQSLSTSPSSLPAGWLRAVTGPSTEGVVYGVSKDPPAFFARSSDGSIASIGPARGYTTSLALGADGRVLYMPGAHGDAWEDDATLYALDPASGSEDVVVSLNSIAEQTLGLSLGGTYSVATSNDRSTIYLMFNAGTRDDPWGEVVLAVVHL